MTPRPSPPPETLSFEDLRALAAVEERPCITLGIAIPDPLQIRTRLKNTIRDLEKRLHQDGMAGDLTTTLLEPIQALASSMEAEGEWSNDMVLYRSPSVFRRLPVPQISKAFVEVGTRFQIRPLLSVPGREQTFYLLALSQKNVRLFRGTARSFQQVDLRGTAPQNLKEFLKVEPPDHTLDNRSSGGPSVGSMGGVMFGTNTDRERKGEYLAHFFKAIGKGVDSLVRERPAALLLAGVESEAALYRRVNAPARLIEPSINGSPDGLAPAELHRRALDAAGRALSAPLTKLLQEFREYRGTNRVAEGAAAVLKAAYEGRVLGLLLREDAERRGRWDETSLQVRDGTDDLLNLAASATLLHGGQAFATRNSDAPEIVDAAAVLRF